MSGGNPANDYGPGFYCTKNLELAYEWASTDYYTGFANKYELDDAGLAIINLNSRKYHILNWLAVLLENRIFDITASLPRQAKKYILDKHGKAWRLTRNRHSCVKYLAALRFSISEEDYRSYIGEHPELEDPAAELDAAIEKAGREWKNAPAGRQNKRLQTYLRKGQTKAFDNYAQQRIRELRDRFREDNAPSF